jgi:hypothetical protein
MVTKKKYFVKSTEGKMLSMTEHPPTRAQIHDVNDQALTSNTQKQNPTDEEDTGNADGNTQKCSSH